MDSKAAQSHRTSSAPRADRRMSTPSDPGSPPQVGETAEMRERRRKQNRIAQQAFRARQKVRVEALETEWQQLRQLHEALNHASVQRAREIEQLHSRVDELLQDIEFLKSSQELERGGWPSPSSSSSSSSSAPSSYEHRYLQSSQQHPAPQFDLSTFFHKGAFLDLPEFPLREAWTQHHHTTR